MVGLYGLVGQPVYDEMCCVLTASSISTPTAYPSSCRVSMVRQCESEVILHIICDTFSPTNGAVYFVLDIPF